MDVRVRWDWRDMERVWVRVVGLSRLGRENMLDRHCIVIL
jgi:hypothetical protein